MSLKRSDSGSSCSISLSCSDSNSSVSLSWSEMGGVKSSSIGWKSISGLMGMLGDLIMIFGTRTVLLWTVWVFSNKSLLCPFCRRLSGEVHRRFSSQFSSEICSFWFSCLNERCNWSSLADWIVSLNEKNVSSRSGEKTWKGVEVLGKPVNWPATLDFAPPTLSPAFSFLRFVRPCSSKKCFDTFSKLLKRLKFPNLSCRFISARRFFLCLKSRASSNVSFSFGVCFNLSFVVCFKIPRLGVEGNGCFKEVWSSFPLNVEKGGTAGSLLPEAPNSLSTFVVFFPVLPPSALAPDSPKLFISKFPSDAPFKRFLLTDASALCRRLGNHALTCLKTKGLTPGQYLKKSQATKTAKAQVPGKEVIPSSIDTPSASCKTLKKQKLSIISCFHRCESIFNNDKFWIKVTFSPIPVVPVDCTS